MAVSDFYFRPVSIYYAAENLEEKIREKNIRLFIGEKDCLLPGFVLFVNFAWVSIFYLHIFPLIQVPFVLITGGGDDVSTWRNDLKNNSPLWSKLYGRLQSQILYVPSSWYFRYQRLGSLCVAHYAKFLGKYCFPCTFCTRQQEK
jgi:hypothetical protein